MATISSKHVSMLVRSSRQRDGSVNACLGFPEIEPRHDELLVMLICTFHACQHPNGVRLRNRYCSFRLVLIAARAVNPKAAKASEDGSGTVVPPDGSPKRTNVGPSSPPVPSGMKSLTHAPVLPLNSNTSPEP